MIDLSASPGETLAYANGGTMTPTCDDPAELAPIGMTDRWRSRCGCGHMCCESGTYDEAAAALDEHRNRQES